MQILASEHSSDGFSGYVCTEGCGYYSINFRSPKVRVFPVFFEDFFLSSFSSLQVNDFGRPERGRFSKEFLDFSREMRLLMVEGLLSNIAQIYSMDRPSLCRCKIIFFCETFNSVHFVILLEIYTKNDTKSLCFSPDSVLKIQTQPKCQKK